MRNKLATSPALRAAAALVASLAIAACAAARDYRYFDGGDRVYYQRPGNTLERVVEPHFHLSQAERAFAKGHRAYAAENLEKAAAGFGYFSERAAGQERHDLDLARRALTKLARDVRRGDVDEVTTVERAIADARRVLDGGSAG